MGKTLVIIFSVLGAGLVTAQANARDAQTESSSQPSDPVASKSYTGQIIAADFAATGLALIVGGATNNYKPAALTWSLGSPLVHVLHGHPFRAIGSLFLHLGLPAIGVIAGLRIGSCAGSQDDETCAVNGALFGAIVGMGAATAIDAAVLARLPDDSSPRAPSGAGTTSAPAVSVGRNGDVTFGWRGSF